MKILVIGGTQFLGRAVVDAALAAGHDITLFNRGKTGVDLFPGLDKLRGDRKEGDYASLIGRSFDAVIDVCAYYPRAVRELLAVVETKHFSLISTISVYAHNNVVDQVESAELCTLEDHSTEEVTGETYGGLKVLCEQAAEAAMPGRTLHVRSGLIIGAHDNTDRFPYWPKRVAKGGRLIAPPSSDAPMQAIDARDEAEWLIRSIENDLTGYINVTGPRGMTFGEVLTTSKEISGSDAEFVWITPEFMAKNEVTFWQDLPLYVPDGEEHCGFHAYNIDAALAQGLTFRPISETIAAVLDWQKTLPSDYEMNVGLSAEREATLLAEWDNTNN